MEVIETKLKNVLLFKPFIHEDFRGQYIELFNERDYLKAIKEKTGYDVKFVEENMSTSFKNVLRGFHGDAKTWKLIDCLKGRIYLVVANCNRKDENFGKHAAFTFSDKNRMQVLVPPMHGLAHLVLSDEAFFHYKESEYYGNKDVKQFTYRYDYPELKVWWPINNPVLSERDMVTKEI